MTFAPLQIVPFFFTEAVTDAEGFRGLKVIAFGANFVERYATTFAREGVNISGNALHGASDGTLTLLYTTRVDPQMGATQLEYRVAEIDPNGVTLSERTVATPERRGYVAILPVGENGIALLEGFEKPIINCAGIILTILSADYVCTPMPSPQPKSTILTSLPSAWNYYPMANYLSTALRNS
ncbi:MAG: hypothetical protein ACI81P_000235 [Neolewinella sp.]|jgi:hypothetical protein